MSGGPFPKVALWHCTLWDVQLLVLRFVWCHTLRFTDLRQVRRWYPKTCNLVRDDSLDIMNSFWVFAGDEYVYMAKTTASVVSTWWRLVNYVICGRQDVRSILASNLSSTQMKRVVGQSIMRDTVICNCSEVWMQLPEIVQYNGQSAFFLSFWNKGWESCV